MLPHPGGQRHGKSDHHSPRKGHQFVSANNRPLEESQNDVADGQAHKEREGDSGNNVQEARNPIDCVHIPFHCMLLFSLHSHKVRPVRKEEGIINIPSLLTTLLKLLQSLSAEFQSFFRRQTLRRLVLYIFIKHGLNRLHPPCIFFF